MSSTPAEPRRVSSLTVIALRWLFLPLRLFLVITLKPLRLVLVTLTMAVAHALGARYEPKPVPRNLPVEVERKR